MIRSLSPIQLRHQLERRLRGAVTYYDVCDEHIMVSDAEPYAMEPSIVLPHQLENIVRLHPETTQEQENQRIYGGNGFHRPVEAFRIKNVKLHDAGLYAGAWRYYFPRVARPPSPVKIEGGSYALVSSYSGIQYFGHWLRDDSTTYLLAEEFGAPLCVRTPDWPDQPRYGQLFDMPWPFADKADLDELFFFLDYGQNSHKAKRYRELRSRLRDKVRPKQSGRRVYLKRGDTGAVKRIISNENELTKALEAEGFNIVDITKDSIDTIIETLLEARLLITIEGSQGDHALYTLAEGAGFLAIVPPAMFTNTPKDWTSVLGMKYGMVVGEADGGAFRVNVPDLLKTVEMLEATL